jgi:hypothetical protein
MKLAVYEPPFIVDGEPMPADFAEQLAGLVAADRRGGQHGSAHLSKT